MILIIAEKRSLADNIMSALKFGEKQEFKKNGKCMASDKYYIAWASGHLFTLWDREDYDEKLKYWKLDIFPYIPKEFKHKINEGFNKFSVTHKQAENRNKEKFQTIKELINKKEVTEVWNWCDPDREGQLICDIILAESNNKKPVYRLWHNDETEQGLMNAVKKKGKNPANLSKSAYLREYLDWCVGTNITSVVTLLYKKKATEIDPDRKTIYIGRVIIPTLKIVYDRHMDIINFKPMKYFQVQCVFKNKTGEYVGISVDKYNDKKEIDLKSMKSGVVIDKKEETLKENIPSLFNLTSLTELIIRKYKGYSADKILQVAQSLYEKKLISYPRSPSTYLSEEQTEEAEKVFKILSKSKNFSNHEFKFHTNKSVFDTSKVRSHTAIIPTYVVAENLTNEEELIYNEISIRFMGQFMKSATYFRTTILTEVAGKVFETKEKVLVEEGWTKLYQKDNGSLNEILKKIIKGDKVDTVNPEILNKETQPPKYYTQGTLAVAMENCGKGTKEKEVLKGFEIGTEATRAATISKLIQIGYIKEKEKNLLVTDLGRFIIEKIPINSLKDVEYTGKMEKALKDVEDGKLDGDVFWKSVCAFINKTVDELKKG